MIVGSLGVLGVDNGCPIGLSATALAATGAPRFLARLVEGILELDLG